MRRLVLDVAKALVDRRDEVKVDLNVEETVIILRLRVARSDVGKLVGKQGRTARSIRTILFGAGMKLHKRYALDVLGERQ